MDNRIRKKGQKTKTRKKILGKKTGYLASVCTKKTIAEWKELEKLYEKYRIPKHQKSTKTRIET